MEEQVFYNLTCIERCHLLICSPCLFVLKHVIPGEGGGGGGGGTPKRKSQLRDDICLT